jgi:translation elongation factor EF-1beta
MASVATLFKVYPKDDKTESVAAEIRSKLNPKGMQTEDIGFGIKVIKVLFTFDDSKTSSSKIEESIRALSGVGEVEVEEESLV